MALLAAVLFTGIGLISGTDETAIVAPLALLVILIGVPPAGVIAFFLAAIISKHISHAVPTTLLGIPGDTTAVPMLREAQLLRSLGIPHIALQKAISGGVVSVIIAIPLSIIFALVLTPFAEAIGAAAPWIFIAAAVLVAYTSKGKLAGRRAHPVRSAHRRPAGIHHGAEGSDVHDLLLPRHRHRPAHLRPLLRPLARRTAGDGAAGQTGVQPRPGRPAGRRQGAAEPVQGPGRQTAGLHRRIGRDHERDLRLLPRGHGRTHG